MDRGCTLTVSYLSSKDPEKEGLRRLPLRARAMGWAMCYSHSTFPCGASSEIERLN